MGKSPIEWIAGDDGSAGETWNPIRARNLQTGRVGWFCTKPSEECKFCYSERMNQRTDGIGGIGNGVRFAVDQRHKVELFLDEKVLLAPLHWKKPRRVFPCSMTDLFGEWVPEEWHDLIYAVMGLCPQHTFMVLTKRADRRRLYHNSTDTRRRVGMAMMDLLEKIKIPTSGVRMPIEQRPDSTDAKPRYWATWPLPNIWEGVSVGINKTRHRLDDLRNTPAVIRWASFEPLLESLNLRDPRTLLLDWAVVGGESGPGARELQVAWIEHLVRHFKSVGVPIFVKQLGAKPKDGDALIQISNLKGSDPQDWPEAIRIREYPAVPRG